MSILYLLCGLSIMGTAYASAQRGCVSGIVRDSASGEPLVGANVMVAGTTIGSATGPDGTFPVICDGPGTRVLRFTFVGYADQERPIELSPGDTVRVEVLLVAQHVESDVVVITGTRTSRSVADVPVRVEAIPQEEVEEKLLMTPSNVAMLLNESTGMRVQTTSAAASTANLRIQGLSGRYTQILNDGIPSLGGLSAGLSLTQLVPLDLRQVEVLKGATSSLYGADAIAGVVNFLPKVPGEVPETSILLNTTTQDGLDLAGYHSGRIGETGFSLLASHNRQALFDVDGDAFADVARFERSTVTPRVLRRFADNLEARAGVTILHEDRSGGAMLEPSVPDSASPRYTEKLRTARLEASGHLDWIPAAGQALETKLAWLRSKRDATFGTNVFDATQEVIYADVQYSFDLPGHRLLAGMTLRDEDLQDRTAGVAVPRSYSSTTQSAFAQDEIRLADPMTLLASGRIDFTDAYGTFFVPRLSLMLRPDPAWTFRLGAGTGYKAPTIFVEEAEAVGFHNLRPIAGLLPEESRSVSLDVNWRGILGPFTVDGNSALFLTTLDHALLADEDSLDTGVLFLRNATGATRSLGAELSLRLTYGDLKASIGYTYLFASREHAGETVELELNPRHSLGIVTVWEWHERRLKVGLENYWTGNQRVERNPFRTLTPSYWITGLIAEKKFGIVSLFVNFENIFDTRQTAFEPIFTGGLSAERIRLLPVYAPLEGRMINAGVRIVVL